MIRPLRCSGTRIGLPPGVMRTPDISLRNVGFLANVPNHTPDYEGTAFFVGIPFLKGFHYYLVTARHVLSALKQSPSVVLNLRDGGRMILPLDMSAWRNHPTDASADVAVMPIAYDPAFDVSFIHTDELLKTPKEFESLKIGPGDAVFFPSLFVAAPGEARIVPLMRQGNLALMPREPIQTEYGFAEVYLVEARSIPGISGSPVFVRQTLLLEVNRPDGSKVQMHGIGEFRVLGVMHGHWDVRESEINKFAFTHDPKRGVNMGIAIVTPAIKIQEALQHPDLVALRQQIEREVLKSIAPHPD